MQERARLLRRLSAEHLRHLARPFWLAGWRPADVLHAIDHEPGGRQHGYTAAVRSPAAWIRARLAAWLGPDGTPLPSPGQQRAAAAARARADAAARREEAARLAAARTADTAAGPAAPAPCSPPAAAPWPATSPGGRHAPPPPARHARHDQADGRSLPASSPSRDSRGTPQCTSRKNARPAASSGPGWPSWRARAGAGRRQCRAGPSWGCQ